jgi:diketogulonate reductase-like aldo/keto reductase
MSWVQSQPGVTSTIIGARTVDQLDQNRGALDVALSPSHQATLDALSQPTLPFLAAMMARAGSFMHGGISVNGDDAAPSPFLPTRESKRY